MALAMRPRDRVRLTDVPASLLAGLPEADQAAIRSAVGRKVIFAGIDPWGRSELEFRYKGDIHTIWIEPEYAAMIEPV